ncbi:hypothetical protein B0H19DRAFT_1204636 [Mycena capillaripes]|nr:hypothetical protein B0H19DRAFT_1204636 [Mycena capillaripes]
MSGVAPEPFSNLLDKPVAPSPISKDILDTNNPPAEVNLSSIREFVSRGRALSPLRRMPTEIISLIFTFATPPFTPFGNVMSVQEGPWALSAVCSRWRIIILSSPCFWTSLSLDFTDDDPESSSFAGIVPMLEAHLERSQQLPLDVTFGTFYNDDCTQRERHVLELLALHCRRWETIQFTGPSVAYTLLEDIGATSPSYAIRCYDPLHLDLFQSCPRLEEAFFNTGGYGEDCSLVTELPFPQLQRYGASNPWANHVHALRLHLILFPLQAVLYYHTSFAYPYRQIVFCIVWIPPCSRSCTVAISPTASTPF